MNYRKLFDLLGTTAWLLAVSLVVDNPAFALLFLSLNTPRDWCGKSLVRGEE